MRKSIALLVILGLLTILAGCDAMAGRVQDWVYRHDFSYLDAFFESAGRQDPYRDLEQRVEELESQQRLQRASPYYRR